MPGEEKFGYFCLSEGTEGEAGSFSSRRGWFEFLCGWGELTADCPGFVCEECSKVISC